MTVSDIITLLTLIIAIIAIINERNRNHLRLKFIKIDYILLGFAFILINYFVYYNSFSSRNWIFSFFYFENFGFKNPKNWAYIISLLSLIYIYYKIWQQYFYYQKIDQVSRYYNLQIENNEFSFLIELIEKYHKKDVINYIKNAADTNNDEISQRLDSNISSLKERVKNNINELVIKSMPFSTANRNVYSSFVLFKIINHPAFIRFTANNRPYFYTELFEQFTKNKRHSYPDDLIKSYFKELVENRNYWLKKELISCDNFDSGQPRGFLITTKYYLCFFKI